MKQNVYRVGIVGAGHICPFHLQALGRIDDVQVVGIHDADTHRAADLVRQYQAGKTYASYSQLVSDVEVVHVLTPPASHAALTLEALESGCDVFVEKPLAPTVAECQKIQQRADQLGRTVGVDHSLLMDPFTRKAKRLIAQGAIGRVVAVECIRSQDYPEYTGGPYPEYAREGGDPFRDLGIHSLYQIEAFVGPIRHLQWIVGGFGNDPLVPIDEWRAIMTCENGTAHLHISWNVRPLQDLIIVQGTEGVLKIDRFGMNVTVKRTSRLPEHPQRVYNAVLEGLHGAAQVPLNMARVVTKRIRRYHGLQTMVAEFYDALRENRPSAATPDAAVRIAHWLDQVATDADHRQQVVRDRFSRMPTADTLVTGATGFIGGHLLRRLMRDGRRVRILCRRPPTTELADHPQIDVVLGDLGNPEIVDQAIAGVDVVYHVGGTVHGTPTEFWRGSVVGTQNVVDSCLRHHVKQLVYVSSLSVLQAIGQEGRVADESAPLEAHPERRGLYTQTKLAAEQIVRSAVHDHALPAAIVRPGEVIGAGAPLLSSGIGQRRGDRVLVFGDGQLDVPLIHVQDLVDAMLRCEQLEVRDGDIFHLVDPQSMTQNELARQYMQLSGDQLKIIHLPKVCVLALGLAVQTAFIPLRRTPPVSLYRLRSALTPRRFDIRHAQRRLDWRPARGIQQGLSETINGETPDATPAQAAEVERVS